MTSELVQIAAALPSYDIGGEIGRGAWGVVLSATHRQLGRTVAIKQLPRAFAADASVRHRFVTEARLLAVLDHPHIVPIFDYIEQEGVCLLVMEMLSGGTVWQRFTTTGLAMEAACSVALATAGALGYAHDRGVLHRDIKPENLLLTGSDTVKVSDFGIAKIAGGTQTMATTRGEVLGTPAYMSPEQALGRELTPATDLYALGTVLFELLSGRLPFDDDDNALALLHRHVYEQPVALANISPDVPEGLCDVVMRCLAKDPKDRYQTAEEVGIAIADSTTWAWGPGWHARTGLPVMASESVAAHLSAPRRKTLSNRMAANTIVEPPRERPAVKPDDRDDHASAPLPSAPSRVVPLASMLPDALTPPDVETPGGWPATGAHQPAPAHLPAPPWPTPPLSRPPPSIPPDSTPPPSMAPKSMPPTSSAPGLISFRCQLALSLQSEAWPGGATCTAELVVDHAGAVPLTIRARDEPASVPDAGQLGAQVLALRARHTPGFRQLAFFPVDVLGAGPGFECRFTMNLTRAEHRRGGHRSQPLVMYEQYLVEAGRAVVVACPEAARPLTQTLRLGAPLLPADTWFEPRFEMDHPSDWSTTERATIRGNGIDHTVTAERIVLRHGLDPLAWRRHQIETLLQARNAKLVEQVPARILHEIEGEVYTARWEDRGTPMLTKLGIALSGGQGFAVTISLPHREQGWFPTLAGHARLRPDRDRLGNNR